MERSAKKCKSMDSHYCSNNMTQYVLISLKYQNSEPSKYYQTSRPVEQMNRWAMYNHHDEHSTRCSKWGLNISFRSVSDSPLLEWNFRTALKIKMWNLRNKILNDCYKILQEPIFSPLFQASNPNRQSASVHLHPRFCSGRVLQWRRLPPPTRLPPAACPRPRRPPGRRVLSRCPLHVDPASSGHPRAFRALSWPKRRRPPPAARPLAPRQPPSYVAAPPLRRSQQAVA
jgi:hypothetical protein